MDQVQFLRSKADASGHLQSNAQQKVIKQDGDVYVIEPAEPDVVYVPTYEPDVVYGPCGIRIIRRTLGVILAPFSITAFGGGRRGSPSRAESGAGTAGIGGDTISMLTSTSGTGSTPTAIASFRTNGDTMHIIRGAVRPHGNGVERAERRRESSKNFRHMDRKVNGAKVDRKIKTGDASRFRHKSPVS